MRYDYYNYPKGHKKGYRELPKQPTMSYRGSANNTSSLSTYTFSNFNLGKQSSNRRIIVGLLCSAPGTIGTVSSSTIGGVSATTAIDVSRDFGAGGFYSAIISAVVPSGETGNIVINLTSANDGCLILVWAVYDLVYSVLADTDSSSVGADLSLSVDRGYALVTCDMDASGGAVTITWAGINEDFETFFEGVPTSGGGQIVTEPNSAKIISNSLTSNNVNVAAAWR